MVITVRITWDIIHHTGTGAPAYTSVSVGDIRLIIPMDGIPSGIILLIIHGLLITASIIAMDGTHHITTHTIHGEAITGTDTGMGTMMDITVMDMEAVMGMDIMMGIMATVVLMEIHTTDHTIQAVPIHPMMPVMTEFTNSRQVK